MRSIHSRYGFAVASVSLQLLVVDDAALLEVDQEHLARLQAPLLDDLRLSGIVEHADFRGHHDQSSSVTM